MLQFENHGLDAGMWSGLLTGAEAPDRIALVNRGAILSTGVISSVPGDGEGVWRVTVELPASVLSDGVHSLLLVADAGQGEEPPLPDAMQLDCLHLMAGAPLEHELLAEIHLMRAELDLLKREFRRLASFE